MSKNSSPPAWLLGTLRVRKRGEAASAARIKALLDTADAAWGEERPMYWKSLCGTRSDWKYRTPTELGQREKADRFGNTAKAQQNSRAKRKVQYKTSETASKIWINWKKS